MGAEILRNERNLLKKSFILDTISEKLVWKSAKNIERVILTEYNLIKK